MLALEKVLVGGLNLSEVLVPGGDRLLGLIVAASVACRSFAKDVYWRGSGGSQGFLSLLGDDRRFGEDLVLLFSYLFTDRSEV